MASENLRDETPIDFTVSDRILAESTAKDVVIIREDLRDFILNFNLYLSSHKKQHITLDAKVNTLQNSHKVTYKMFKLLCGTIATLGVLTGIAKALNIL